MLKLNNINNPFKNHPGFSRTFIPNHLTFGLIAPFKGYDGGIPNVNDFGELAQMADNSNISTLWIRDVPTFDPKFGDAGQLYDPSTSLGYLSALTKNITLGSAGYISTLRNPVHIAKDAASLDKLSNERFLLGLATGDRPIEYTIFDKNFDNREQRFREGWDMIKRLHSTPFPNMNTKYYGNFTGSVDFLPKPQNPIPMLPIGQSRQSLDWIANNADAWIWHGVNPNATKQIVKDLDNRNKTGNWHPFGYSNFLKLDEDPNAPLYIYGITLIGGSKALVNHFKRQEAMGMNHSAINLEMSGDRPAKEVLQQFIEEVASQFPLNN